MGTQPQSRTTASSTNRTAIAIAGMACVTAALLGHWQANAGPLDPPANAFSSPGVPGPSGPTLGDVLSAVQASATPPVNSLLHVSGTTDGVIDDKSITGSGVLVAIMVANGGVTVTDGTGKVFGDMLAGVDTFTSPDVRRRSPIRYDLNARYTDGLSFEGFTDTQLNSVIVLYRPDAP